MDAAFPYFSAKDDYSLLNMYKHTALKTYSPFLRNQDFVHPCSQGDMAQNINSFITTTMPNASLANSASIHGSSVAFHISHQGLKQESGIPSYHPPIAVFSDPCDINRLSFNTSDTTDKVEAEIIIPSDDSCIRGGFGKHCNNCTDANIWASSTSGQTSVAALTNFDIGKGKKRSFAQNKCLGIKSSTRKDGQTKRLCCSKKSNSGTKQKTAHSPANTKKIDTEPPKDFIHVRARRGQATDSHSLAERVRREKINERLRFLKDLVPGCSKTVGKTAMLEEIINYVHSLQRQVEFLSMKLAAVSPLYDFSIELNTSAKEPHVEEGGEVLVRSFSNFEGTTHDSILKEASTASFGETA